MLDDIKEHVGKPDTSVPSGNAMSKDLDQDNELYEAQTSTQVRWSLKPDITHSIPGCHECVLVFIP